MLITEIHEYKYRVILITPLSTVGKALTCPLGSGLESKAALRVAGFTVHEFHETCLSVIFYFMKKDSKRWCDTTTPSQFTPKMKANADPRLLSSLV